MALAPGGPPRRLPPCTVGGRGAVGRPSARCVPGTRGIRVPHPRSGLHRRGTASRLLGSCGVSPRNRCSSGWYGTAGGGHRAHDSTPTLALITYVVGICEALLAMGNSAARFSARGFFGSKIRPRSRRGGTSFTREMKLCLEIPFDMQT